MEHAKSGVADHLYLSAADIDIRHRLESERESTGNGVTNNCFFSAVGLIFH